MIWRLFILSSFQLFAEPAYITFPADIDWVTKSSDHFDVLFRRGHDDIAIEALKAAERAHQTLVPIFPDVPPRTWIVLADFTDNLNGYALDILYPHMVIFVAPPEPSGELAILDDWFSSVIFHEFTHNLHLYPAEGLWAPLRSLFGSWMAPTGLMPMHFHEGMAVLMETQFTRSGRGRGANFSMLRRMAVHAKAWGDPAHYSIDRFDGTSAEWPFGTSAYFMGYNLYEELWARKGAVGIKALVDSTSRIVPYFLNHSYQSVFGMDYESIWDQIFAKTKLMEEGNIQEIRKGPLSKTERVTHSSFVKGDLHLSTDGQKAVFRSYTPKDGSSLEFWDLSKKELERRVEEKVGGAEGICWHSNNAELLLVTQSQSNGYTTNDLKHYDWGQDALKGILEKEKGISHVRTIACNDSLKSIAVFKEFARQGEVVFYEIDQTKASTKFTWKTPLKTWASGLLIQNEVTWIALRRGVQTDFYRWINGKDPELIRTADGHFYNLRNYNGTSFLAIGQIDNRNEIYIVDPIKNTLQKYAAFLGGISSFDAQANALMALNYHHGGYDLERIEPVILKPQSLSKDRKPDSPALPEIKVSETMEYSPTSTLGPKGWVPLLLFVPSGFQAGFWIPGFDISQRHFYDLIAGYDSRGTIFGDFGITGRFGKSGLRGGASYTPTYFRIGNGLVLNSRSGAQLTFSSSLNSLSYSTSLIFSKLSVPVLNLDLTSVGVGIGMGYSLFGLKSRPLGISPYQGTYVNLSMSYYPNFLGSTEEYSYITGRLDQYLPSIITDHSFYLSLRAGWTHGTQVANSYFDLGGEYSFAPFRPAFLNRGLAPSKFAAREIVNLNIEYRLPLFRIDRGYGILPLKLKRIHAALVTDISTVDQNANYQSRDRLGIDYYASSGVELKSDWIFSYYFPSQLRLGAYHGYGALGEPLYFTMALEATI